MTRIVFGGASYTDLSRTMLVEERETCAVVLANCSSAESTRSDLLVREVHPSPDDAYAIRTELKAQLHPEFLIPLVQRARQERMSVMFVHTHPFAEGEPSFSPVDDEGEMHLASFMSRRVPELAHAALVIGPDGCAARRLGSHEPLTVTQVGSKVDVFSNPFDVSVSDQRWDRQVRAFGARGQSTIRRTRVAIVGMGGTGSVVAEQLAHLGVTNFLLVDPDIVDETNLNRLVGATPRDVGTAKTIVATRQIQEINPAAMVKSISGDATNLDVADVIAGVDAIFGCTDTHASRAVLNQLAYQYYVPLFDVGVGVVAKNGQVTNISGRVQMASPGLPCLLCAGVIDPVAVRRELQSEVQRAADPYIPGFHEPQPAVISLNSTMASLAVTMFMSAFTPIPGTARLQYYNAITGVVRAAVLTADPSCIVCSRSGALGLGNKWSLPGRARASSS